MDQGYFGLPRWNLWCTPGPRNFNVYDRSTKQACFRCEKSNFGPFYHTQNRKCYRCGNFGHIAKECRAESRKPKSITRIQRDRARIIEFINRKTCAVFPFSVLDDSEYQELNSKSHSGLRLENKNLRECVEYLDNIATDLSDKDYENKRKVKSLQQEILDLKVVHSSNQKCIQDLKNEIAVLEKEQKESATELSNHVDDKLLLVQQNDQLQGDLEEQRQIVRRLEHQIATSTQELEKEKADYHSALRELDFKVYLNEEIKDWRKMCEEKNESIQYFRNLWEISKAETQHWKDKFEKGDQNDKRPQNNRGLRNKRNSGHFVGFARRTGTHVFP